ncbi:hypothetical protein AMK59_262 [Oryctes borbonicus]|uniref:Uncharacterized protein n=1 Tax=Oryctes borbonicus TaxID=1629725 RepID=A0A0T6BFG2_9SCAR|nr:hypothetical protein AMK59_262 [Oryctes borbonicus]
MAIPFTIPNQEVSQLNIQELLRELCEILQQLLIICRQQSINQQQQQATRNRASTSSVVNQHDPIPEIMTNLSLLSAAFNSIQTTPARALRRPRRYRLSSESSCDETKNFDHQTTSTTTSPTTSAQISPEWMEVDMDLRKISEDFKAAGFHKDDDAEEEDTTALQSSSKSSSSSPSTSTKRDSIFSKFVPAPFTGSICTAVICVVGWHLLRNR